MGVPYSTGKTIQNKEISVNFNEMSLWNDFPHSEKGKNIPSMGTTLGTWLAHLWACRSDASLPRSAGVPSRFRAVQRVLRTPTDSPTAAISTRLLFTLVSLSVTSLPAGWLILLAAARLLSERMEISRGSLRRARPPAATRVNGPGGPRRAQGWSRIALLDSAGRAAAAGNFNAGGLRPDAGTSALCRAALAAADATRRRPCRSGQGWARAGQQTPRLLITGSPAPSHATQKGFSFSPTPSSPLPWQLHSFRFCS